jgi:hypothetical protein
VGGGVGVGVGVASTCAVMFFAAVRQPALTVNPTRSANTIAINPSVTIVR